MIFLSLFIWGSIALAGQAAALPQESPLRVNVQMVEVYAAVLDGKKNVSGLKADQFRIWEDGKPQKIISFEAQTSPLSIAMLLDTTGSMQSTLPLVKNAALRLLESLRPEDTVALFSFANHLEILHPFSRDRQACVKALLGAQAQGTTALFDALAQTASELRKVNGKKVLISFTDGDDNSSLLSQNSAINSLKKIGVPVYSMAQGPVLQNRILMNKLGEISKATGGLLYEIKDSDEIVEAFDKIGKEVQQLYMLGYYPQPDARESIWRKILVELVSPLKYKVRAKEGYRP